MAAVVGKRLSLEKSLKHVVQSKLLWHNGSQALVRSDLVTMRKMDATWEHADKLRRYFLVDNIRGPLKPEVKELGWRLYMSSSKPKAIVLQQRNVEVPAKQPFYLPEKMNDFDGSLNSFVETKENFGTNGETEEAGTVQDGPEARLKSVAFSTEPVPPRGDVICQRCGERIMVLENRTFASEPNCCAHCLEVNVNGWICKERCLKCYCILCPACAIIPGSHDHDQE